MLTEPELRDAIASLARTARDLRARRQIGAALELEQILLTREAELATLTS